MGRMKELFPEQWEREQGRGKGDGDGGSGDEWGGVGGEEGSVVEGGGEGEEGGGGGEFLAGYDGGDKIKGIDDKTGCTGKSSNKKERRKISRRSFYMPNSRKNIFHSENSNVNNCMLQKSLSVAKNCQIPYKPSYQQNSQNFTIKTAAQTQEGNSGNLRGPPASPLSRIIEMDKILLEGQNKLLPPNRFSYDRKCKEFSLDQDLMLDIDKFYGFSAPKEKYFLNHGLEELQDVIKHI